MSTATGSSAAAAPTATASAAGPILYVVSRFPSVSETFVVDEWWALASRFRLELAAILPGERGVVHPASQELLGRVLISPLVGGATVSANLRWLARGPRRYLTTLWRIAAGSRGRPAAGVAKGVAVFVVAAALADRAQRLGVRHVHAHLMHHPATAAWAMHRLTGLPFSVTVHADDLYTGPALLDAKVADARFVATISEYNRRLLHAAVPGAGRIEVIHCGVDVGTLPYRERRQIRRLVCVARLVRPKGHADLLRGLATVVGDLPELTLDIVGDGAEREALEELARRLGLAGRVRFHGALPSPAVRRFLDRADAFVLPLRHEAGGTLQAGCMDGIPVALMEAMACGLPVVTGDLGGVPELVQHERNGWLVEPCRPDAVAAALRRLAADPDLCARLGRQARADVDERFSLVRESARLGDLFESALAEGPV